MRLAAIPWDRFVERVYGGDQSFGALYFTVLRAWSTVGQDPFTIRLLSVVLAVATLPLFFALTRRLFSDRVALIATPLLAINPFLVRYAQEARAYALALLLMTAATYLLLRVIDAPSRSRWLAYAAVALLAVFAHFFAAFVVAFHFAVIVHRGMLSRTTASVFGGMALAAAPLGVLIAVGPDRSFIQTLTASSVLRALHNLCGGMGFWLPVHGIAYLVAVVAAVRTWRPRWPALFSLGWFAVPVVGAVVVSLVTPILLARYLIVVLPPLVALAAAGVARLPSPWLVACALGAFVGLSAHGLMWWYVVGR